MKRILKSVVSVLLLLCLAFSIVGCKGEAYKNIEKYHAEIISDYEMNSDYIMANQTKGYTGNNALPKEIVNVITNQTELKAAFSDFPKINFEKEMVIVYFYTSVYNRPRELKGIEITEEKEMRIHFIEVSPGEGIVDACSPKTRPLVVKLDKIEDYSFVFIKE
ncbi:MAG: hypothetical protein E7380_02825 [Clostridiales bacterium]|nr:hypothetical protein [Clostridiales bacterium]